PVDRLSGRRRRHPRPRGGRPVPSVLPSHPWSNAMGRTCPARRPTARPPATPQVRTGLTTRTPKGDSTMRFLNMIRARENAGPPPSALMGAIAKLGEEAMRAGVLVETGGLFPSAMGARVRLSGGYLVVTDGPFTETKELIGGYAVYDVKSKQEAIEWTSRFM